MIIGQKLKRRRGVRIAAAEMFDSIPSRITAAVLIVVIGAAVAAIVLVYTSGGPKTGSNSQEPDYRRIITYQPKYGAGSNVSYVLNYARIQDIPPNSSIRFLDPFGKTISTLSQDFASNDPISSKSDSQKSALVTNADAFEQYVLIRLAPELGGNNQTADAFRAYSDLDPESKCLLVYRGDSKIGALLQDPCHSDIFRVSDGYSCSGRIVGTNPVLSGYNAVPRIKLSLDSQGYLLAARPDGQPSGDGTVGEGRIIPVDGMNESDKSCDSVK